MAAGTAAALIAGGAGLIGSAMTAKSASDSTKSQMEQAREKQAALEKGQAQARESVLGLSPIAMDTIGQGYSGAADLYRQTPGQAAMPFIQGNVAAQNQLISSLPLIQQALSGQQVDFSSIQPTSLSYDPAFLAAPQVPNISGDAISTALGGGNQQATTLSPDVVAQLSGQQLNPNGSFTMSGQPAQQGLISIDPNKRPWRYN